MAKLSGPLLSFGASGSIADAITYTKRKRQDVAKSHSVPANPNTSAQAAQRGFVSLSSEAISAARVAVTEPFRDVDVSAWELLVKTEGTKQTWHNRCCSNLINVAKSGFDIAPFRGFRGVWNGAQWVPRAYCDHIDGVSITQVKIYWGFSPAVLTRSANCTLNPPSFIAYYPFYTFLPNTRYYYQFVVTVATKSLGVSTGISFFDT